MVDSQGGICQSCAMPVHAPEHFGTDHHGRKTGEYCNSCYQHGSFTEPEINVKGMIEKSVEVIMHSGMMPEAHIRETISVVIPKLKRWANSTN
jgi:hypothetical protein